MSIENCERKTPLKKLFAITLSALLFVFGFGAPAFADGAAIFGANCNACHIGGGNAVMPMKTLKLDDLKKYLDGYKDGTKSLEEAIAYQVTNGKGAMPAFRGRIPDAGIAEVAAYVADQAENNKW